MASVDWCGFRWFGIYNNGNFIHLNSLWSYSVNKELILNNNIREVRQQKGISQQYLALTTGTTRQTIIAIEKGTFYPTAKLALLICIALDKKFEELFYF